MRKTKHRKSHRKSHRKLKQRGGIPQQVPLSEAKGVKFILNYDITLSEFNIREGESEPYETRDLQPLKTGILINIIKEAIENLIYETIYSTALKIGEELGQRVDPYETIQVLYVKPTLNPDKNNVDVEICIELIGERNILKERVLNKIKNEIINLTSWWSGYAGEYYDEDYDDEPEREIILSLTDVLHRELVREC